jgi:hypothetical protein
MVGRYVDYLRMNPFTVITITYSELILLYNLDITVFAEVPCAEWDLMVLLLLGNTAINNLDAWWREIQGGQHSFTGCGSILFMDVVTISSWPASRENCLSARKIM